MYLALCIQSIVRMPDCRGANKEKKILIRTAAVRIATSFLLFTQVCVRPPKMFACPQPTDCNLWAGPKCLFVWFFFKKNFTRFFSLLKRICWHDQGEWVTCQHQYSILIYQQKTFVHSKCCILLQTPSESDIWLQFMNKFFEVQKWCYYTFICHLFSAFSL